MNIPFTTHSNHHIAICRYVARVAARIPMVQSVDHHLFSLPRLFRYSPCLKNIYTNIFVIITVHKDTSCIPYECNTPKAKTAWPEQLEGQVPKRFEINVAVFC